MELLYSTNEAARYLGFSRRGLQHHIYVTKLLHPQHIGRTLVFTRDDLDLFRSLARRRPGRPRTNEKS